METRAEITTRYAKAYRTEPKKERGRLLDEMVAVTGWTRDNARLLLAPAARSRPGARRVVAQRARRARAPRYSYDARKVQQRVRTASGGQCGKYLAVALPGLLDALERSP